MFVGTVPSAFCSRMAAAPPQSRQSIARFGRLRSGTIAHYYRFTCRSAEGRQRLSIARSSAKLIRAAMPSEDQRRPIANPIACHSCGAGGLKGSKMTPLTVLLRCPACAAVQTIAERRQHPRENRRTSRFPDVGPDDQE